MVGNSRFHRRSHTQRGMDATEIVVEEIQRNLMGMVLKLLTESVGKASIATHPHAHRTTESDQESIGIGRDNDP